LFPIDNFLGQEIPPLLTFDTIDELEKQPKLLIPEKSGFLVDVFLDEPAYLHCKVKNRGPYEVIEGKKNITVHLKIEYFR